MKKNVGFRFLLIFSLYMAGTVAAIAAGTYGVLDRSATKVVDPSRSVLLGIARASDRLVAVGEHGLIIYSDDNGASWQQAAVPVSVTLTAVRFATPNVGWAIGHLGVVLHTQDGGKTWAKQLDGMQAATLVLEAAKNKGAHGESDAAATKRIAEAELLVKDGPDKPFLDLYFEDEKTGFIVGAYNLCFHTVDAGAHWQSCMDRLENPKAVHLYGIGRFGGTYYIVGEQGLFLRSTDGGKTFQSIVTLSTVSIFALGGKPSGQLVLAGLRGVAIASDDNGASFKSIEVPTQGSFVAATTLADGTLVLVNQVGQVLASRDGESKMALLPTPPTAPLGAIVQAADGALIAVGLRGVMRIAQPSIMHAAKVKTGAKQ